MDWTNRFNYGDKDVGLGSNNLLASLKTHFQEYFITGKTDDGIIDLKLDIIGDETLTADSDVTDHYVESNIAYQDQISLKPKIYTVNGEVGELVWYQRDSVSQAIGQVAQRLEGIISFLPIRSKSFNQMKTKAMKAAQWIDTASNAVSKLSNLYSRLTGTDEQGLGIFETQTNQQQAYIYLLQFRDNRQVISIKTPWGILKNYVITNIKFTQPKETKDKSVISITFKEFRTTSVGKVEFDAKKYQGNAVYENEPKVDNGKTYGNDVSISSQVSRDMKGNPFKQVGDTLREGSDYLSQTSDSSEVLNVWYNSESHQFKVTDMYDNIVTGTKETQAFKSVENGIKTAINNRYGNPPLR